MAQAYPKDTVKCLCCNYRTNIENDFLKHVKVHRFEPNFRVPCMVCPQILKNVDKYRQHKKSCVKIKKNEDQKEKEDENAQNLFWQCQNCPETVKINVIQNITDFKNITKHIFVHSRKNERYIFCGCGVSKL